MDACEGNDTEVEGLIPSGGGETRRRFLGGGSLFRRIAVDMLKLDGLPRSHSSKSDAEASVWEVAFGGLGGCGGFAVVV